MSLLDKYIIHSSVFAIFTEAYSFHYGIDLKLFYIIILANFFVLSINKEIKVHKNIIYIIGFFLVHGICLFLLNRNPIKSLFSQLIGISVSSIFFYNLLLNYKTNALIRVYKKYTFLIALIAIPMYLLKSPFNQDRLHGILSEPAHYATIMLPATYLFLRSKEFLKLAILLLTIVLSKSSVGFIGVLLIIILSLIKIKNLLKYTWLAIVVFTGVFIYLKLNWNKPTEKEHSYHVIRRLKETKSSLNSVLSGEFKEHTNLSSYAFLSNSFIAREIVKRNPFGTGLGSYQYEYEKKYHLLQPPKYLVKQKLSKINQTDANSLFLRMLSDLGVFGIILIIFVLYLSVRIFKGKKIERQSMVSYLLVKLLREGHYFPPEFYFFLLIFLKDFDKDITYS